MSIRVSCPNCRLVAACPDDYRGKAVRCKKCGQSFVAGPARRPVPVAAPASRNRRGRFLIAAALAVLVGATVGVPAAHFALKKNQSPEQVAVAPAERATAPEVLLPSPAPVATKRQERPLETSKNPPPVVAAPTTPDTRKATVPDPPPREPPPVVPAEAAPVPAPPEPPAAGGNVKAAPKVSLAGLRLTPPEGWQVSYNKFLPAWELTKPSATGRVDPEVVRVEECPEDARTPSDYATRLKEKDFLNVDLPGWVQVGDKGELPDGFFFAGVVKKYSTPKTPPVLGLLAVREVGGLKVRCFSTNLRSEASRAAVLEAFKGATLAAAP